MTERTAIPEARLRIVKDFCVAVRMLAKIVEKQSRNQEACD
jgi:hypothetical protein